MPLHTQSAYNLGPTSSLKELAGFQVLQHLASSMLSIFSVIYLYVNAHFSLLEITLFFTAYSIIFLVLAPLGAKFAAHYGVKKSLLISTPLYLLMIGGYYLLSIYPDWLFLVALLAALFAMFYWPALHIDFVHALTDGREGRELGLLYAVMTLTGVIGAVLGGFLYETYGAWAMFLAATVFILASVFPLILTKDVHEPFSLSYQELIQYCCRPGFWPKNIVWAAHSVQVSVLEIYWPFYIYIVLESIWSVAWLTALTIFITMLVMMLFGKLVDQWSRWAALRIAAFFNLLIWTLRIFVFNPLSIAIVDAAGRSASGAVQVSVQAILYKRARRKDQVSFLMRRELFHHLGKVLMLLIFAGFIAVFGEAYLFVAFVIAAVACLGYFLIY